MRGELGGINPGATRGRSPKPGLAAPLRFAPELLIFPCQWPGVELAVDGRPGCKWCCWDEMISVFNRSVLIFASKVKMSLFVQHLGLARIFLLGFFLGFYFGLVFFGFVFFF